MKYFLVKEDSNWSGEFGLQGFKILQSETLSDLKNRLLHDFLSDRCDIDDPYPVECFFGTNESILIESEEVFFNALSFTEITEDEYNCLVGLFPDSDEYAFGPTVIL